MTDLNSVMFYKAKFTVKSVSLESDLLWEVVCAIKRWMTGKHDATILTRNPRDWSDLKIGRTRIASADDGQSIYIDSAYFSASENETYWACKITEKPPVHPGYSPRRWTTEVGFEQTEAGCADISCVLTYADTPGFIGPCEPTPGITVPRLMNCLLESPTLECFCGCDSLSLSPKPLAAGDYKSFLEERLFDKQRKLPYILVCPMTDSDGSIVIPINPRDIMDAVAMNALVFYANDTGFQQEMKYYIAPEYLCYPGSIRVYMPNMNLESKTDSTRHRYITAQNIEDYGADAVVRLFRRALAQDMHYYDSMFRIEDCKDKRGEYYYQRKLQLIKETAEQEKLEGIQQVKAEVTEVKLDEAIEYQNMYELAEHNNRIVSERLKEATENVYNLRAQVDGLQTMAQRCRAAEEALNAQRQRDKLPSTPEEIVDYFETVFSDRIAFTDNGKKSLQDCTTSLSVLWDALFSMSTTLYDLHFIQGDPQYHKTFRDTTGWQCARGEGSNTRKDAKLIRQYIDTFRGQEINIEAHVKNGVSETDPKFIRIYFGVSDKHDLIVIGSCGQHKENASTRKAT